MKRAYATTLLLLAATCGLQAAKDDGKLQPIPADGKGRFGVYTFADAKEEAGKKKRPIVLIVQSERTEEAAEKEAAQKAYWGMAKDATMVMVTSRLIGPEGHRMGTVAPGALNSEEAGKKLPKMVVLSQDAAVVLGVMNMDQIMAADDKAWKEFSKKMEEGNKNPTASAVTLKPTGGAKPAAPATAATTTPAAAAPAGPVAIKDPKAESWTNAEGKAVQMALLEVNGTQATFQLADGRKIPLDLSKLSDASKKRVEELVAASK